MILEVKNLFKSFGEKEILHGISFSVESGKALGLLGRNGAGKTTTIRILMDVFHADSGEILIDGQPFIRSNYQIGYLPEERGLYPKKKVLDQIIYLAQLRGIDRNSAKKNALYWLKRLEVDTYAQNKLETLSKGNQQKVQLASTLVTNPDIIILDEPFSGLDPVNAQILKDIVQSLIDDGKIVIFSSHQMSYVEEFCENIAIINKGEIVLDGELSTIKHDFGKDQLVINAENMATDELAKHIETDFAEEVHINSVLKDYVVVKLSENITKNAFLKKLLDLNIDIEHFENYKPSLNDIFVEKAGEN